MKIKCLAIAVMLICIIITTVACVTVKTQFAAEKTDFLTKEINFLINTAGIEQNFASQVVIIDDDIYVSLQDICERFDLNIGWDESKEVMKVSSVDKEPNYDAVYHSEEGTLQSGRKYRFFGLEETIKLEGIYVKTFSLQDYIVDNKLRALTNYNIKEFASTPKEAAEIAEVYFGFENKASELASLIMYYDIDTDNYVIIVQFSPDTIIAGGGPGILAINRTDGSIKMYNTGLK